jgi:hypothetical protein
MKTSKNELKTKGRREAFFSLENYRNDPDNPDYKRNSLLGEGVMLSRQADKSDLIVPITPANEIFFIENHTNENAHPRVSYLGSGLIVSMLTNVYDFEKDLPEEDRRKIAYFDIDGGFHDQISLIRLEKEIRRNGHEIIKHSAVFSSVENKNSQVVIVDIYSIAPAKPNN